MTENNKTGGTKPSDGDSLSQWLIPNYSFFDPDKHLTDYADATRTDPALTSDSAADFEDDSAADFEETAVMVSTDAVGDTTAEAEASDPPLSPNFKLRPTLVSIFWKSDLDNDNRLSKTELQTALNGDRLTNEEELICGLLLHHFDDMRRTKLATTRFFDTRGVNLSDVVAFAGWTKYLPLEAIEDESPDARQSTMHNFPCARRPIR